MQRWTALMGVGVSLTPIKSPIKSIWGDLEPAHPKWLFPRVVPSIRSLELHTNRWMSLYVNDNSHLTNKCSVGR